MCSAGMSGHHVPMFAVADGPPGVAAAHMIAREGVPGSMYASGPERGAMISKVQVACHEPYAAALDPLTDTCKG